MRLAVPYDTIGCLTFTKTITILMLFLLLLLATGCMTHKQTQKAYIKAEQKKVVLDAIIVPGLAFDSKNWGTLMKRRVIWSWRLYKNGLARNVIYSGAAVYSPYKEAL